MCSLFFNLCCVYRPCSLYTVLIKTFFFSVIFWCACVRWVCMLCMCVWDSDRRKFNTIPWWLVNKWKLILLFYLKMYSFIWERESGGKGSGRESLSRLLIECWAWCEAESQDTEVMTWTEIKGWTLNWLSHLGSLSPFLVFLFISFLSLLNFFSYLGIPCSFSFQ